MKYAFIGSGNMARGIIGGMVKTGVAPEDICVINPNNPVSTGEVRALYGVCVGTAESLETADAVVIAVKPQTYPSTLPAYLPHVREDALIVSIMGGITIESIEADFPGRRVARVMPNLNLAVGKGASGYALGTTATEADGEVVRAMFSAAGVAVEVPEDKINDVAALSGSGSAYLYYLIEALREVAVEDGIEPETADMLSRATLIGAAALLEATGEPPEELRRRITSKKGTTDAAIRKMTELNFPEAVKAGYRANKKRSEELARGE